MNHCSKILVIVPYIYPLIFVTNCNKTCHRTSCWLRRYVNTHIFIWIASNRSRKRSSWRNYPFLDWTSSKINNNIDRIGLIIQNNDNNTTRTCINTLLNHTARILKGFNRRRLQICSCKNTSSRVQRMRTLSIWFRMHIEYSKNRQEKQNKRIHKAKKFNSLTLIRYETNMLETVHIWGENQVFFCNFFHFD